MKIVEDEVELRRHYEWVRTTSNRFGQENGRVVVQELLVGEMFVVNTVSLNGAHLVSDVYQKSISICDGLPISNSMILVNPRSGILGTLLSYTFDCLDAIGVANGPAHSEVILTDHGPRLVEVNSRLMGPSLPADVFVPALGYSQATLTVEAAASPSLFVDRLEAPYGIRQYVGQTQLRPHTDGILSSLTGFDEIRSLPGFSGIYKVPEVGLEVQNRYLTTASSGIAYFRSDSRSVVEESIERTRELCSSGCVFSVRSTGVASVAT